MELKSKDLICRREYKEITYTCKPKTKNQKRRTKKGEKERQTDRDIVPALLPQVKRHKTHHVELIHLIPKEEPKIKIIF